MLKLLLLSTVALSIECATVVSSPQIKYCAYRNSPYSDTEFGGHAEIFNNGTAKCTLSDDVNELVCMTLFHVRNITRSGFNYSEEVEITSQTCWAEPKKYESGCLASDVCTGERRRNSGNPVFFCCCKDDYCNTNDKVGWVEPKEIILPSPAPVKPDLVLGYLIPFVVAFILIGAFIIFIFCIRKTKQQHDLSFCQKIKMYNYERRIYSDEPPLINDNDVELENCSAPRRFGDECH